VTLNNSYVREQRRNVTSENWKEEIYLKQINEAVALQSILKNAQIEHDVQLIGDFSYRVEKKFGYNYAIVGDAGAFLDPIFSSGIYVAMETAKRVASCIDIKFTKGDQAGRDSFEENFNDINAGYSLIEKFVRLFYDPELLKFSELGSEDDGYTKFLNAYEIFHYLLAGDFFTDHKKYSDFIDDLNKERSFNQFIHYVKTKAGELPNSEYCKYTFEEVYGHLPERAQVAPGLLSKQDKK
jgi:flavin-dependent dehydrogenase